MWNSKPLGLATFGDPCFRGTKADADAMKHELVKCKGYQGFVTSVKLLALMAKFHIILLQGTVDSTNKKQCKKKTKPLLTTLRELEQIHLIVRFILQVY